MTKAKKILFFFTIFALLFTPHIVFAALLRIESDVSRAGVLEQFQVDVMVDTEGDDINAVEGQVVFARDLLKVTEIRDGASIVPLWVQRPEYTEYTGSVSFSGIIPGGYQGEGGLLFSILFESQKEGASLIEVIGERVMLNTPDASLADVSAAPLRFEVVRDVPPPPMPLNPEEDTELPEAFTLYLSRDTEMFDWQWFVVFAAHDKMSGIDHYTIAEVKDVSALDTAQWNVGESPYVLQDQGLSHFIAVKAVDKAGNERISFLAPEGPYRVWYTNYVILVILVLIVFLISVSVYFIWRLTSRSHQK